MQFIGIKQLPRSSGLARSRCTAISKPVNLQKGSTVHTCSQPFQNQIQRVLHKIMASSSITSWQTEGENTEAVTHFIFLGSKITGWWLQPWNKKMLAPRKESYGKPRQCIRKINITLPTKVCIVKAMVFPVIMHGSKSQTSEEGWALKNCCFQTVVLEKTLESSLDCTESKPVNPKGKSVLNIHWKFCYWSWWSSNTLAT